MILFRTVSWMHCTSVFCKHIKNRSVFVSSLSYHSYQASRCNHWSLLLSDNLKHRILETFSCIVVFHWQGGIDDGGAATVRAIMHWQYRTISREKTSILYHLNQLLGRKAHDYISFYGLRTYGRLFEAGPIATSQVLLHFFILFFLTLHYSNGLF